MLFTWAPSVAYLGFGKGGHGERAEREPITGSGGGAPSGVKGQSPWSGVRGRPLKLKRFLLLNVQWKPQIRPFFLKFGNAENHSVISDAISHGDFNRKLYRYEKRPSNIVEFCNSCWKTAKNAFFSYKVALKNFHGRAKRGASHRGPPPKYATAGSK